jgi:hypothetical protein
VEREGDPESTMPGQGLEREECGWWGDEEWGGGGTVMCQRSGPTVLEPVRKGVTEKGVKKCDRGVSEEGVPVRANEGRATKQGVRQFRRRQKIEGDRKCFVGKG